MRQHFRFGRRPLREPVSQNLGDAPMQPLPPALEKIFVGRILNKRVLEAIVAVRRDALDEQNIGCRELFQCGLQRRVCYSRERAEKAIGEPPTNHRADLRNHSGRAKSVATGGSRGCRLYRPAPVKAASLPRRTAARRRCAPPHCPPPRAAEHGGPPAPLSCRGPARGRAAPARWSRDASACPKAVGTQAGSSPR